MNVFQNSLASAANIEITPIDLLRNDSYSWWVEPRNVYHKGVNYFTSISSDGHSYINRYNANKIDSVKLREYDSRDEHNAAAILCREHDILAVMHPRNSTDFQCRTVSYDLKTMGGIVDINIGAQFVSANYSQVFEYNGRTFIFCRESVDWWAVTWSDDGGISWNPNVRVFGGGFEKKYIQGVQDGQKIVFGGYQHPNSDMLNKYWISEFDCLSGEITHKGVSVGSIYDPEWTDYNTENFDELFVPTLGKMRFLDIAFNFDKSIINSLLIDIQSDNDNGKYYLLQTNRTDLSEIRRVYIQDTGIDGYPTYFGGAYFVQDENNCWTNRLYLSRESGGVWYLEEYMFVDGVLYKTETIDTLEPDGTTKSIHRPEPPIGSNKGGLKIIYQKGDYFESFTGWDNYIIGIK